jgi:monosaccharide-transporting ATPase
MVAISRALNMSARVLILDEPTSSLDEAEVQLLFGVLRGLREQGMAILFVTHFLDQTYAISDRITVMRNGEREGEYACSELSRLALVNKMVGAAAAAPGAASGKAGDCPVQAHAAPSKFFLRAVAWAQGRVGAAGYRLRQGELLGLCGLLGSGRTEAARLLFGADKADAAPSTIGGKRSFANPARRHRRRHRLLLGRPQARRRDPGIVGAREPDPGFAGAHRHLRAIPLKRQQQLAEDYVKWLGIKTASIETPIGSSRAATSRRCCWRAGWRPSRRC